MKDYRKELQKRLRQAIEFTGHSQTPYWELSQITGIAHGTLRNIFTGRVDPKAWHVSAICRSLHVSADWMLLGEECSVRIDDYVSRHIAKVCQRRPDIRSMVMPILEGLGEGVPTSPDNRRDGTDGL